MFRLACADQQNPLASFRVYADQRIVGFEQRHATRSRECFYTRSQRLRKDHVKIDVIGVQRTHPVRHLAERFDQILVGHNHVCPNGIAAIFGHLQTPQDLSRW